MGYLTLEKKKELLNHLEDCLSKLRTIDSLSSNQRINLLSQALERKITQLKKEIEDL